MPCELCADDVHTTDQHQVWLDWHDQLLAGEVTPGQHEPPLARGLAVDASAFRED